MTSESERPKIVFFGTPEFAVPSLEALIASEAYSIIAAVTQPDKPAGRGQKLSPSPIKLCAEQQNISVFQPKSIKSISLEDETSTPQLRGSKSSSELAEFLNENHPIDVFVCVAYGKLIPTSLLEFARCGMLNIHPSLLPRWRGAAPLQRAIFAGDEKTGVSLMDVDEGLDSGPVYCTRELEISPSDNLGTLHNSLAQISGEMLVDSIPLILSGKLKAQPQALEGATYAEKWEKHDAQIDWAEMAEATVRRIRTCAPMPGARTTVGDDLVKIFAAQQVPNQNYPESSPGQIVELNRGELVVAAGQEEFIAIEELQFPGKKKMSAAEVFHGRRLHQGDFFR